MTLQMLEFLRAMRLKAALAQTELFFKNVTRKMWHGTEDLTTNEQNSNNRDYIGREKQNGLSNKIKQSGDIVGFLESFYMLPLPFLCYNYFIANFTFDIFVFYILVYFVDSICVCVVIHLSLLLYQKVGIYMFASIMDIINCTLIDTHVGVVLGTWDWGTP
ncbi:hypothetical protein ACJX0J_035631 [Zea mays]